jgi:hypothetical protein
MADPRPRSELDRYLLDGERLVAAVHQHWGKVAEPVLSAVAGGGLAIWADASLPRSLNLLSTLLWWAWFALVARAAYRVLEWRLDWFVATDKRLLLFHGFITRKVAMMPLSKVTDMTYNRSVPGRLLGYGRFVMESAGQDQALREVNWVPQPDHHYRAICAEIFEVDDHERMTAPDEPYAAPGQPGAWSPIDPEPLADNAIRHGDDRSTAIRVRPRSEGGGSVYRSPDLEQSEREADTGPIPYFPPEEWRP